MIIERPEQLEINHPGLLAKLTPENTAWTIHRLASRWQRARMANLRPSSRSDFTNGRSEGYVQAIAMLLDCEASYVRNELQAGRLGDVDQP